MEPLCIAPGTVIISAAAEVRNVRKVVEPVLKNDPDTTILYIDFSQDAMKLGGSALAQVLNQIGDDAPTVTDPEYFAMAFNTIQELVEKGLIRAGHDVSAGGIITTLLEMTFANISGGLDIDLSTIDEPDLVKILFSQNPAVVIQVDKSGEALQLLDENGIKYCIIGKPVGERSMRINHNEEVMLLDIDNMRDTWYRTSYLLDRKQTAEESALLRYKNYKNQNLDFRFPENFNGKIANFDINIRRKHKTGYQSRHHSRERSKRRPRNGLDDVPRRIGCERCAYD